MSVPSQNRRKNDPRAPSSFTWGAVSGTAFVVPPPCLPGQVWAANNGHGLWLPHTKHRDLKTERGASEPTAAGNPAQKPSTARRCPRKPVRGQAPHCWLWGRIPATATSVILALCSRPSKSKAGPICPIGKCSVLLPPCQGRQEMEAGPAAALPVTRGRSSQMRLLPLQYKPQLPLTHSRGAASSFGIWRTCSWLYKGFWGHGAYAYT